MTVELPFDELGDEIDAAYKRIATQVQIPGFRKGKVPRQIIDQRFGRGAVLEEVVNAAVPPAYDKALAEADVVALGQPQVEVTEIEDGEKIGFVAEVDIRPEFELPQYKGLAVEVAPLEVTDADSMKQTLLAKRWSTEVERHRRWRRPVDRSGGDRQQHRHRSWPSRPCPTRWRDRLVRDSMRQ
jgi:trigger factor